MQVFQSWADIAIMLVLVVAYIVTFIAQRNLIKSLKEAAKSQADLTASQSAHISAYKNLFNVSDIDGLVKLKIESAVAQVNQEARNLNTNYEALEKSYNRLMNSSIHIIGYIYGLYKQDPNMTGEEREAILKFNFSDDIYKIMTATFKILDSP